MMCRVSRATALLMTGLLLAGCHGETGAGKNGEGSTKATSLDISYELDRELGAVILPADRALPDRDDSNLLGTASTAATAVCARKQGVPYMADKYVEIDIYRSEGFFGPWTMWQAEKFGFAPPNLTDADLRANDMVPEEYGEPSKRNNDEVAAVNGKLSEEDLAVIAECGETSAVRDLEWDPGSAVWLDELGEVESAFFDGKAGQDAFEDLYDCYRGNGMEPNPEVPWIVQGANERTIDAEQIELAVKTVRCKEETKFVERIAEEWATAQAEVLVQYEKEFAAAQIELDEALKTAETYIAEHPEVFAPPQ